MKCTTKITGRDFRAHKNLGVLFPVVLKSRPENFVHFKILARDLVPSEVTGSVLALLKYHAEILVTYTWYIGCP